MKKIITLFVIGFVGCAFIIGCENKSKTEEITQKEEQTIKEKEQAANDLRKDYTYKGKPPVKDTKFPGME